MNVSFRIRLPNGTSFSESELNKNLKLLREMFAKHGSFEGALTIENLKTNERSNLGDTLEVLISAFCLEGLERLKNVGKHHVDFF
ncbi:MAG: hypothetical protein JWQ35_2696 [Bacteriovoracaceae bacterium]|nr:hypothetical protein [Bacteriovoracaceae bacterium]